MDSGLLRSFLVPYKLIHEYCRVRVEGVRNIPSGAAVLAANHTGWLGLDYANLAITIHDRLDRVPRGVVHKAWFRNPRVAAVAHGLGLVPAEKEVMARLLEKKELVIVFPEAEQGAFKVTKDVQYHLLDFRRGFVRAALRTGAPIVPVAILGGEEANPVLRTLKITDRLFRLPLPVPKNILPYPVKWRISILPPISMRGHSPKDAADSELVHGIAAEVRRRIQRELEVQIRKRGNKYL